MRDFNRRTAAILRMGAICLALGAGAASARPKAVKLASAGFWTLSMVKLDATSSMCAASTRDNVANAVFDYIVVNRTMTAFRIGAPALTDLPDAEDALFILQVDRRRAIAIQGRKGAEVVVLAVDKDAEAKRQFVRDMAEGEILEVRRRDGALVGTFQLMGAGKVLRAFGLCVARLPNRATPG